MTKKTKTTKPEYTQPELMDALRLQAVLARVKSGYSVSSWGPSATNIVEDSLRRGHTALHAISFLKAGTRMRLLIESLYEQSTRNKAEILAVVPHERRPKAKISIVHSQLNPGSIIRAPASAGILFPDHGELRPTDGVKVIETAAVFIKDGMSAQDAVTSARHLEV